VVKHLLDGLSDARLKVPAALLASQLPPPGRSLIYCEIVRQLEPLEELFFQGYVSSACGRVLALYVALPAAAVKQVFFIRQVTEAGHFELAAGVEEVWGSAPRVNR
jgi:hypothetical protein